MYSNAFCWCVLVGNIWLLDLYGTFAFTGFEDLSIGGGGGLDSTRGLPAGLELDGVLATSGEKCTIVLLTLSTGLKDSSASGDDDSGRTGVEAERMDTGGEGESLRDRRLEKTDLRRRGIVI